MTAISIRLPLAAALALTAAAFGAAPAGAADIVSDWSGIQLPPAPTLKPE